MIDARQLIPQAGTGRWLLVLQGRTVSIVPWSIIPASKAIRDHQSHLVYAAKKNQRINQ